MNEITTEDQKEAHGWVFKCKLIKKDAIKGHKVEYDKLFEGGEAMNKVIGKCFDKYDKLDESDWKPYFEMFKCLVEETEAMKSAYENIEKVQIQCNNIHNVREIDIHENNLSKKNQNAYGCYVKCVHESLGSFEDEKINSHNLSKSFPSEIKGIIADFMDKCIIEVDKQYQTKPKNSCEYFFDYNLCTDKNDFLKNL